MRMSRRVLVVDDDKFICEVYRRTLSQAGYEVEVAGDGQQALDRLPEFRPDAVLLDLMMPRVNGLATLKMIRASEQFNALPVVVSTLAFVGEMIRGAVAGGATKIFNKTTLTPPLLLGVMRELFADSPLGEAARG